MTPGSSDPIDLPLPTYLDRLAESGPQQVIVRLLEKTTSGYSAKNLTIKQLSNAVNEAALWLNEQYGPNGDAKVIAFMAAPSDIRYMILLAAAIKVNRLAFFPSPGNDAQAHISLFKEYKCQHLMLPRDISFLALLRPVIEQAMLNVIEVPDLDYFLRAPKAIPPTWTPPTDEDLRMQAMVGVHTSGSTGLPKAVYVPHGNFMAIEHWKRITDLGHGPVHVTLWKGKTVFSGFPLFHMAAIDFFLSAMVMDFTVILSPTGAGPLTPEFVREIIHQMKPDFLLMPPSVLADMTASKMLLQSLSKVQGVAYGGGPLLQAAGDRIAQHCDIYNLISTTEVGIYPSELLDRRYRGYLRISPVLGFEMRPHTDNLYELVLVRDKELKNFQVPFFMFPDLHEYATKDLFRQHPTQPELWSWQGRTYDTVVFSSGEKFNTTLMENIVNSSPHVKSALVYGNGRLKSALLVEPNVDEEDSAPPEDIIDRIWPTIQQANANSASHGRVTTDMIIITDSDRHLPRNGKGTVQRKAAFKLYEADLDQLYATVSGDSNPERKDLATGRDRLNAEALAQSIVDALRKDTGKILDVDDNFFAAGLDSLGVTNLILALPKLLPNVGTLTAKAIYEHGSAIQLAKHLVGESVHGIGLEEEPNSAAQMEDLFRSYTFDLPMTARKALRSDIKEKAVILTGSTGTFGTYLLDQLLRDETVAHIVCLNRRENAEQIQRRSLEEKGLATDLRGKTLTFAKADFSRQYLGLDSAKYKALLNSVTHVVHNAWHVNFNLPLKQFEKPHVSGIRQLVDFSARSTHGAMIFFISSIGAVSSYRPPPGSAGTSVPEVPMKDWSAAAKDNGYSQSKLVAENILAAAARDANVPCAVCRIGQLAGPVSGSGVWPKHEWLPSLILSSKYSGDLPDSLGRMETVDWVPVDTAAKVVREFFTNAAEGLQKDTSNVKIYHCVNPKKTTWKALLPSAKSYSGVQKTTSLHEWVEKLEASEEKASEENPGAKLVGYYKSLSEPREQVLLQTNLSKEASDTLNKMGPITADMIGTWVRNWV